MLSCKEVSELVSQSMDRKLPFWQRVGVRVHLMMCRFCAGFRKQLYLFREAARRNAEQTAQATDPSAPTLSSESRERMRRTLKDENV